MVTEPLSTTVGTALILLAVVVAGFTGLVVYRLITDDTADSNADLAWPMLAILVIFSVVILAFPLIWRYFDFDAAPVVNLTLLLTLLGPWVTFTLRYTGRDQILTRRRILLLSGMGFVDAVLVTLDIVYPDVFMPAVSGIVVSLLALAALGIIFVCIGVVILSVSRHEALGFGPGLVIVAPVVLLVLAGQVIGQQDVIPRPFLNSLFILASAVCFWLAVTRYDVLRKRPGTSALGERAVVEDMQEIILVVNDAGEVVRSNRRAQQLSDEDEDVSGTYLEDLLDADVQTLRNRDVITQWTTDGRKRFDPRVSTITGGTGQKVGNAVTLIDVTGREIREQRIQVLNRILRHNIRNEVSVIEARAELAMDPDQPSGEHLELISEVADDLEGLSANARQIEKLMQGAQDRVQPLRIDDVTESVAADVLDDDGVTVETDLPAVSLRLDPGLLRYALRQLIENAVEHNDADTPRVRLSGKKTSSGVEIVVSDNGPGIPKAERDVIVAGSETSHDHASSLGLWGTNWAAQTLGGTLSFEQSSMGGAAVRLELPATDASTHDSG